MADLRRIFDDSGCTDVVTYIQSGNVVFVPPKGGLDAFRPTIENAIAAATGMKVAVVLRSAAEMAAVLDENPFPEAAEGTLHVSFLSEAPPQGHTDAIDREAFAPEDFALRGRELYIYLPDGMGRSKLAVALGKLRGTATVRNWRTVTKLVELSARE